MSRFETSHFGEVMNESISLSNSELQHHLQSYMETTQGIGIFQKKYNKWFIDPGHSTDTTPLVAHLQKLRCCSEEETPFPGFLLSRCEHFEWIESKN
ncbi:hypothetical protein THRCLA_09774 [Thraustotheca clavata]|uniref:Uncharacterized protein n=1 Tax=Thraustotheca clavata TaxID=74557 RepID=A0A1V9YUJ9_9STRA|nr:hypothetical protein THRCLA_09774 [Thraustotheca clavata]